MRWISTHSKATLLTSSQRIRELEIAKMRREEIERQNKFAICLQQKANELDLEKIAEDNQRKLIEAKMVETELKDAELEIDLDMKKNLLLSSSTYKVFPQAQTKDWVHVAIENRSESIRIRHKH